jgi:membrane protein required for colicin V production
MTLDLALALIILVFALYGAATGAAKQIANAVALVAAYLAAGPVGRLIAPRIARQLDVSELLASVGATLAAFLVVLLLVRLLLVTALEQLFASHYPDRNGPDRALGFVLGGAKAAALAWVILCAMTFIEDNVRIGGRRVAIAARDSRAVDFARRHNLFDGTRGESLREPVRDLARVAGAAADPKKSRRLAGDPAWQRLQRDARFQKVMKDPRFRKAIESGDEHSLRENDAVMQLLQDPAITSQLELLARSAD